MFKLLSAIISTSAVSDVVSENANQIQFDPQGFLDMLPYMGKGMLVIFIIIGAIILTTLLVNVLFSEKK